MKSLAAVHRYIIKHLRIKFKKLYLNNGNKLKEIFLDTYPVTDFIIY